MSTLQLLEIKELSTGGIADQLNKSRLELVDLRMKFVTRQLEDTSLLKKKRKEIAQLLTVQTQSLKEKKDKPGDKSEVKSESKIKRAPKATKKKPEKKTATKERKK